MREEEEEETMSVRSNLSGFYRILSSYNSNVLLAALVFLLLVVLFVLLLHFYARYFWSHSDHEFYLARRQRRRRRNRRRTVTTTRIIPSLPLAIFNSQDSSTPAPLVNDDKGLDSSEISKIPLFVYEEEDEEEDNDEEEECVICLGLWEVGDFGRKLRNCGHGFHVECIDMWLSSHSTCPLCRSPVLALSDEDNLKKPSSEEQEQEEQEVQVEVEVEEGEVRIEVFDGESNGEGSSRSERRSTSSSSLMRMLSGRSRSECKKVMFQDSSPS